MKNTIKITENLGDIEQWLNPDDDQDIADVGRWAGECVQAIQARMQALYPQAAIEVEAIANAVAAVTCSDWEQEEGMREALVAIEAELAADLSWAS